VAPASSAAPWSAGCTERAPNGDYDRAVDPRDDIVDFSRVPVGAGGL